MGKKLTTEEFIEKAKIVHNNKYDYSLVKYTIAHNKIKIICPEHGIFEQAPYSHLNKQNCPKCYGRNKTTEEFISEAKLVHDDRYDYSLVNYVNAHTKIKIICRTHGVFEQLPYPHLNKINCPKCYGRNKTTEEFISEAKLVHGDKYDYSLTNYSGSTTSIIIYCKKHGNFFQRSDVHLQGSGCPNCVTRKQKLTTEEFIEKAKIVHNNRYDYSLVDYSGAHVKVKIICPEHGVFEQVPYSHLNGNGCIICSGRYKYNTNEFILKANKIHDNKYDYSLTNYVNAKIKVNIICSKHGVFNQVPGSHLNGIGCDKCGGTFKLNNEEFISRAKSLHDGKYNYSLVNYTNINEKVKIICPIHSEFMQIANDHLNGSGCPNCTESKGEKDIRLFLLKHNINFIQEKPFNDCKDKTALFFDFYLPDNNSCIEYNGLQHYEPIDFFGGKNGLLSQQKRDKIKFNYCRNNNIPLLIISYNDNIESKLINFIH